MGFVTCQKASNFPYRREGLGSHLSGITYEEVKHRCCLVLKHDYKLDLWFLALSPLNCGVDQVSGDWFVPMMCPFGEGEKEQLCFWASSNTEPAIQSLKPRKQFNYVGEHKYKDEL